MKEKKFRKNYMNNIVVRRIIFRSEDATKFMVDKCFGCMIETDQQREAECPLINGIKIL